MSASGGSGPIEDGDAVPTAPTRPRRRPRLDRLRRWLRSLVVVPLTRAVAALVGLLPWRVAQRVGAALGRVAWRVVRRDRRRTRENLRRAFPEMAEGERRRLAAACFRHHGTSLAEYLHLSHRPPGAARRWVDLVGAEHLEAARRGGAPILLLTGHCGNWELLGPALFERGIPLTAVVRRLKDPGLESVLAQLRERHGTTSVVRGEPGAARRLLVALRRGQPIVMLIDQDTRVSGTWVPFFGRLAFTPVGAAELALKRRAKVLPIFDERLADGRHRVTVHPPLDLPDDPVAATARMTEAIEAQVRRRPEQWVWMHRRWRRQPPAGLEGKPA